MGVDRDRHPTSAPGSSHGGIATDRERRRRGPDLAKLAVNQIQEKHDWALTVELRFVGYASHHFDESGARDAAKEILASHPRADLQP